MAAGLVLIPTYNERDNVELIIRAVFALPKNFHVLIIDDGSPDGTGPIVRGLLPEFAGRLFLEERSGKQGLGTAYIFGFRWALARGYEYVFEMDADFSHNPQDLLRLHEACAVQGYDLAIGSRYSDGVNVVNWPMSRVLMSYFASKYVRMVTGMPIHDATAGFKCYSARVLRAIDLKRIHFVGYAFQIEMKWLTYRLGFRIKEVPIIFTDRTRGQSKMSKGIFKEAFFGVVQMKVSSWIHPPRRTADEPQGQPRIASAQ
ncbi:polyprenol monophosphomannose synthase [Hymenobacter ginsengisoli]|uniref:Polyprenol monophosphomannose synthase n=1 Tax=Hymenobacter ginsengisoli TaxID=1051626 RepID=A0ABP8Q3H2_9BACT|nr:MULTISPECIES: polyprenol monophosphomannose synthase [unclassified Hymenobacter]MBO2031810.1 polyprenol monophosphomannose synthase [Hymenobacter sp. BT559]